MDIEARIRRRQRRDDAPALVLDYGAISPVTHVEEPVDRGPMLDRLLDHFDPVFDGMLPADAYVWGQAGAGKSAVLTALVTHARRLPTQSHSIIHTSTRAQTRETPAFVYVDTRGASSEFGFYRDVLDAMTEETIPRNGVGTDAVRRRLDDRLADRSAVLVVDHVGEPETVDPSELDALLAPFADRVAVCTVGRDPPDAAGWADRVDRSLEVAGYQRQVLVDILMTRASEGLARRTLEHALARRLAEWADGNAHDALAALLVAADMAATAGREHISEADIESGIADVPRPCVSLGRVMALPKNRRAVLREFVDLDRSVRESVSASTTAIAEASRIDLSSGTVKRFLYELAETGILRRIESDRDGGQGRPPSRIEARFPTAAFRRLYDLGV